MRAILIALSVGLFVGTAAGLRCYECQSSKNANRDEQDEWLPGYTENDNCFGGKLPDSFLIECNSNNTVRLGKDGTVIKTTQAEKEQMIKQGQTYSCWREYEKRDKDKKEFVAKGCTYADSVGNNCAKVEFEDPKKTITECRCHKDKCNGVGTLLPSVPITLLILTGVILTGDRHLFE